MWLDPISYQDIYSTEWKSLWNQGDWLIDNLFRLVMIYCRGIRVLPCLKEEGLFNTVPKTTFIVVNFRTVWQWKFCPYFLTFIRGSHYSQQGKVILLSKTHIAKTPHPVSQFVHWSPKYLREDRSFGQFVWMPFEYDASLFKCHPCLQTSTASFVFFWARQRASAAIAI